MPATRPFTPEPPRALREDVAAVLALGLALVPRLPQGSTRLAWAELTACLGADLHRAEGGGVVDFGAATVRALEEWPEDDELPGQEHSPDDHRTSDQHVADGLDGEGHQCGPRVEFPVLQDSVSDAILAGGLVLVALAIVVAVALRGLPQEGAHKSSALVLPLHPQMALDHRLPPASVSLGSSPDATTSPEALSELEPSPFLRGLVLPARLGKPSPDPAPDRMKVLYSRATFDPGNPWTRGTQNPMKAPYCTASAWPELVGVSWHLRPIPDQI